MLTVPGSLDERIVQVLMRKAQDIAALWDAGQSIGATTGMETPGDALRVPG
jgi:hypothetical protein